MAVLSGHGTLYDTDDNELGAVSYRIEHDSAAEGPIVGWSGELTFEEDVPLEAGRHVLETEDGTRGDIEVEPVGATAGGARQVVFTGVGVFGAPVG